MPRRWGIAFTIWRDSQGSTTSYGVSIPDERINLRRDPARPALVLDVRVNAEQKKAALIVAYGTGVLHEATQRKIDLIIDDWDEVRALGLHKPTRFALSPQSRMQLPWCADISCRHPTWPQPAYSRAHSMMAKFVDWSTAWLPVI